MIKIKKKEKKTKENKKPTKKPTRTAHVQRQTENNFFHTKQNTIQAVL